MEQQNVTINDREAATTSWTLPPAAGFLHRQRRIHAKQSTGAEAKDEDLEPAHVNDDLSCGHRCKILGSTTKNLHDHHTWDHNPVVVRHTQAVRYPLAYGERPGRLASADHAATAATASYRCMPPPRCVGSHRDDDSSSGSGTTQWLLSSASSLGSTYSSAEHSESRKTTTTTTTTSGTAAPGASPGMGVSNHYGTNAHHSSQPHHRKQQQQSSPIVMSQNMTLDELCVFRTRICPRKAEDDSCTLEECCPFSHCLSWHRRNPRITGYRPTLCPNVVFSIGANKKMRVRNHCRRGRLCLHSHTKEEQMYHPLVYKTQLCRDWPNCTKHFCPFAHGMAELRSPQDTNFPIAQGPEKPEIAMEAHRAALAITSCDKHQNNDRLAAIIKQQPHTASRTWRNSADTHGTASAKHVAASDMTYYWKRDDDSVSTGNSETSLATAPDAATPQVDLKRGALQPLAEAKVSSEDALPSLLDCKAYLSQTETRPEEFGKCHTSPMEQQLQEEAAELNDDPNALTTELLNLVAAGVVWMLSTPPQQQENTSDGNPLLYNDWCNFAGNFTPAPSFSSQLPDSQQQLQSPVQCLPQAPSLPNIQDWDTEGALDRFLSGYDTTEAAPASSEQLRRNSSFPWISEPVTQPLCTSSTYEPKRWNGAVRCPSTTESTHNAPFHNPTHISDDDPLRWMERHSEPSSVHLTQCLPQSLPSLLWESRHPETRTVPDVRDNCRLSIRSGQHQHSSAPELMKVASVNTHVSVPDNLFEASSLSSGDSMPIAYKAFSP